jgi:hypothetical protein
MLILTILTIWRKICEKFGRRKRNGSPLTFLKSSKSLDVNDCGLTGQKAQLAFAIYGFKRGIQNSL